MRSIFVPVLVMEILETLLSASLLRFSYFRNSTFFLMSTEPIATPFGGCLAAVVGDGQEP
jgi:hypothetical protein